MTIGLTLLATAAAQAATTDKVATTKGDLVIHAIHHATFVMTWGGRAIYVDPVGGAAGFGKLPKADLVLITDIHGDHLNAETVKAVVKADTVVMAPQAVADKAPDLKVFVLPNGKREMFGEITIVAVPMYNLTAERKNFHTQGRGNGYVLTIGGKRVYISGDTEDIPEMRGLQQIDAAFVCMNLPYTMDVEQAASAVLEFHPKIVYPYHYRGQGGMSDLEKFKSLVSKNKDIEVRLMKWYPK